MNKNSSSPVKSSSSPVKNSSSPVRNSPSPATNSSSPAKNSSNPANGDYGSGRPSGEPPSQSDISELERWRSCVGCGAAAPKTETAYTLISAMHGWRLTRDLEADGKRVARWRCPSCWAKLKKAATR
jgi:hypothetical protein